MLHRRLFCHGRLTEALLSLGPLPVSLLIKSYTPFFTAFAHDLGFDSRIESIDLLLPFRTMPLP